jgi:hypothetical protein
VRTAAIFAAGFVAVFLVSLLAARGSHGPSLATTHSCGPYIPPGPHALSYVAYATDTDCAHARRVAVAYVTTYVCHRGSLCKAVIDGLHCLTAGTAGPGLGWVACGRTKHIFKPRVYFSAKHPSERSHAVPGLPH